MFERSRENTNHFYKQQLFVLPFVVMMINNCFITPKMTNNVEFISQLLPYLQTELVKQAEAQLIQLCKDEKGLKYLISQVYNQKLPVEERMSAASVLNRMFIEHSQNYKDATIQDGLTFIFGDLTVPYKVKSMLVGYASIRLNHDSQNMYFTKILLGIVEDILMQMEHLFNEKHSFAIRDESWLVIRDSTHAINSCYTVILIGHVIFTLIRSLKTQQQVSQYLKHILKFVQFCGKIHLRIFFPEIIRQQPDVFVKLFELYEQLVMQGANEQISQACFQLMTRWAHLPDDLRQTYMAYEKQELLECDKEGYEVSEGKLALIAFHWDVLYYLNDTDQQQKIREYLDSFVPTIKQTILKINSSLDVGGRIHYAANMLYILQFSYERRCQMDIKQIITDFQTLVLPIILHELTSYKIQLFESSPCKMYEKLCEVIEYPQQNQQILNPVTVITKQFISVSQDFYLYLFQNFRYSMEKLTKCENIDDWQPPQYLQNKEPMELSTVFYIMSFVKYDNALSQDILTYLNNIITFQFVDQLDKLDLAMFYYFLQNAWFQLYDEQLNEAKFLLTFAFKSKLDPSAKYFIYQFINTFSDYCIDNAFILEYSRKLPMLHQCKSKWKTMFNWLTFLTDFEEEFVLELLHIIQGHLQSGRPKSEEEVKNYQKIVKKIGQHLQQLNDLDKMQNISQSFSLKKVEQSSKNNLIKEELQSQASEDQEEQIADEVNLKRRQSIGQTFTKRVKRDRTWNTQELTQPQQQSHPLFELLSTQQMHKKVSDISSIVSKLRLE